MSTQPATESSLADAPPSDSVQDPAGALAKPPVQLDFWRRHFAQDILPLLTSLVLHVAIIIIGLVTLRAVRVAMAPPVREQIIIPDAEMVGDGPPGGVPHPGLGGDPTRDAAQDLMPDVPRDTGGIANKPGPSLLPSLLGGEGQGDVANIIGPGPLAMSSGKGTGLGSGDGTGGKLATFGAPGGAGIGIQSQFLGSGGNARRIAYVCDASGSMMNVMDFLRRELTKSVEKLKAVQAFNVIFFVGEQCRPLDKAGLILAKPENKRRAYDFVKTIEPRGETNVVPSLELAFAQKPELIYLLTDGDFPDNDAVIRLCRQRAGDGRIKINTFAFCARESLDRADTLEYIKMLKTIANDSGGKFRLVTNEDVAE